MHILNRFVRFTNTQQVPTTPTGATMNQAYVVLAQDLNSDDAEWTVCSGPHALGRAKATLETWIRREGRWVGNIRPTTEPILTLK